MRKVHALLSSRDRGLNVGLSIHLHPKADASSEGSGETLRMHRLVWALADRWWMTVKTKFSSARSHNANGLVYYFVSLWYDTYKIEPQHKISNNVHMRSLIRGFAGLLNILRLLSYLPNTIWSF